MSKWTYQFKMTPDKCQYYALKKALQLGRMGIFFEQRVGKSKVAVDFCGIRHISKGYKRVLIVCPLTVRSVWNDQIAEHLADGIPYDFHLYPSGGVYKAEEKRAALLKAPTDRLTFIAVNYDLITTEYFLLQKWKPDIVIFDESHLIKDHNAKRTRRAKTMTKNAKDVLLLTGTPLAKYWYDIYAQYWVMDDKIFGTRWADFVDKFAIKGGYMGKQITGCKNFKGLAKKVSMHSVRVLRKDTVGVEEVTISVDLEPAARKKYVELRNTSVIELEKAGRLTADFAMTRLTRLQQFSGGFIPNDDGDIVNVSKAKLDALKDLVNTHAVAGGEPVLIFHKYGAEGKAIMELLKGMKLRAAAFNGQTKEQGRKDARDQFQEGALDAIVIQISTGAMGICLDRSHINIFYSVDYRPVNLQQARDRVMGRGQKHDVTNYFLECVGTVDKKVRKTLQDGEDMSTMILDNWKWAFEED